MALRCPKCGREYDVTLFEYGRDVQCPCGEVVSLHSGHRADRPRDRESAENHVEGDAFNLQWESIEREIFTRVDSRERELDRSVADEIRRQADRISSLILYSDMPRIDVEIEIMELKRLVLDLFPEKGELFDALYVSRFRRLWNQFRDADEQLLGG